MIFILILLTPIVAWGYLIYWTIKKRKIVLRNFLIGVTIAGILLILFSLRLLPGSEAYFDKKITSELTGIPFRLDHIEFEYESLRHFNGDGYSIYVYSLTDEIINGIYSKPMIAYPIKPDYRSKWQAEQWKKTPVQSSEQTVIDFAVSNEMHQNAGGKEMSVLIRKMLQEEDNYYAYFFNRSGNYNIADIDFFLISKKYKKLIIINHNT